MLQTLPALENSCEWICMSEWHWDGIPTVDMAGICPLAQDTWEMMGPKGVHPTSSQCCRQGTATLRYALELSLEGSFTLLV